MKYESTFKRWIKVVVEWLKFETLNHERLEWVESMNIILNISIFKKYGAF